LVTPSVVPPSLPQETTFWPSRLAPDFVVEPPLLAMLQALMPEVI